MTWAKLCDVILDHPKCLDAGEDATNLFIRSIVWCSKHLTDGRVPRGALRVMTSRGDAEDLAALLVSAGLWEERDGAWWVHDFLDYNPSRAEATDRRAEISAKRSAAGKAGNAARWGDRKPIANASQADRKPIANGVANAIANGSQTIAPSRPVPSQEEERDVAQPVERPDDSGAHAPSLFGVEASPKADDAAARVFAHWQRATGKGRAVLDPKRRTLIARTLKAWPVDEVLRCIDGYASSPWHRGENDRGTTYLDLGLMLRDAAHVEAGIALAAKGAASHPSPAPAPPTGWQPERINGPRLTRAELAKYRGAFARPKPVDEVPT